MKFAMILMVLSIIFLLVAIIYSNFRKNKDNSHLPKQNFEGKKNKANRNIADILDIQVLENFIKTGNRYSCVLRLGNIDYNMLSDDEQETIENVLIQTALSINYSIQFYNTTETIDTSEIINEMKENKLDSYNANKYKEYMIDYLKNLMENRNITVLRNYAIISYDGLFEDAKVELMRLCGSFKSNLLRAKIQTEILDEKELYNLIFRELNKNTKVNFDFMMEGGQKLYVVKTQRRKKENKKWNRYI